MATLIKYSRSIVESYAHYCYRRAAGQAAQFRELFPSDESSKFIHR
jgi:hypothetical protein